MHFGERGRLAYHLLKVAVRAVAFLRLDLLAEEVVIIEESVVLFRGVFLCCGLLVSSALALFDLAPTHVGEGGCDDVAGGAVSLRLLWQATNELVEGAVAQATAAKERAVDGVGACRRCCR